MDWEEGFRTGMIRLLVRASPVAETSCLARKEAYQSGNNLKFLRCFWPDRAVAPGARHRSRLLPEVRGPAHSGRIFEGWHICRTTSRDQRQREDHWSDLWQPRRVAGKIQGLEGTDHPDWSAMEKVGGEQEVRHAVPASSSAGGYIKS